MRTPLLLVAAAATLLACDDASPDPTPAAPSSDARTDTGAVDVLPGDLPPMPEDTGGGAPDTDPPDGTRRRPSGVEARVLTADDLDELAPGPYAAAQPGDILLRNDRVRFVLRAGAGSGLVMQNTGAGGVVDAGPPGDDLLLELLPLVGLEPVGPGTIAVTRDGSDGLAEVTLTAHSASIPIAAEVLGGIEEAAPFTQTYRLQPGSAALEMSLTLQTELPALVGQAFFTSGLLDIHTPPGGGFVASSGPAVSYALVSAATLAPADFGGITLLFGPEMPPETPWTRWLVVGDGSLSSVVDAALELRETPWGHVAGTVAGAEGGVEVVARDTEGHVVTRMRPDAAGAFGGRLPVGIYTLGAEAPGRPATATVEIDVMEGHEVAGLAVSAAPAAALTVTLSVPARITLLGPSGRLDRSLVPGTHVLTVAPGTWEAVAVRGFEYEVDRKTFELAAGQEAAFAPNLVRSVDTAGWIAADFHLHSEWSTDSNTPLPERIVGCAAEGVEYAVATDHDVVTDYGPFRPPALAAWLTTGVGVEVTTGLRGHFNVWPLVPQPDQPGHGSPVWADTDFGGLMAALGAGTDGRVVQVNHPRYEGAAAFDALGFDPSDPDPAQLAVFTFDAIEVFNGVTTKSLDLSLADWFALLRAGLPVAATGVSDAHGSPMSCGHGRTFVEVADDDPATVAPAAIDAAVKAGHTMVSSGPFVTVTAAGPQAVHVRVQAPTWMPVDRLELWADGELDTVVDLSGATGVVRADEVLTVTNVGASWAVAVVRADTVPFPMLKEQVLAVSPRIALGR